MIRVGIVANEFFDPTLNRIGGFGWAARRAAEAFRSHDAFADPVFMSGEQLNTNEDSLFLDGIQLLVPRPGARLRNLVAAQRARPDVLLCIDYRPSYLQWLKRLPRTPVIVWVRDPRTREDVKRLRTLRIPGSDAEPGGVADWDFASLRRFMHATRFLRRKIILANKMAYMRDKIESTFGLPASEFELPNPDVVDYKAVRVQKRPRPTVVSLGRLDPVKRPWLFIELARLFPDVDFLMLGKNFVDGERGWRPSDVPPNVRLLGNVTGKEKLDILSEAWVLVNTAIHEESAVSMLEALAHEVPVISFIESDGISQRFGRCLGYDTGTGMASLPRLSEALKELLVDHDRRREFGRRGRIWVMEEHNTSEFLSSFNRICKALGL